MQSETTKIFKSGGSQAVRIPKSMRFPDGVEEVTIRSVNGRLIIEERGKDLMAFFDKYRDVPRPEGLFLEDRERFILEDQEDKDIF